MSTVPRYSLTEAEFIAWEETQAEKHEFYRGEVFAMAGTLEPHVLITSNLARLFGNQFVEKSCRIYGSDMMVRCATGLLAYPDSSIVCTPPEFYTPNRRVLLNPEWIIEVLSNSTENFDRTTKFRHYESIPTLASYVLIAQDRPSVEHYTRLNTDQWAMTVINGLDSDWKIADWGFTIKLRELYDKIEFTPEQLLDPLKVFRAFSAEDYPSA
jgi:Uma2 family endonuclease